MRRRDILVGSAVLAGAACAPKTGTQKLKPETFVLVHGTWHGGWAWRDVRNILQDAGHRVFTPTCTGCGEREHLSSPDVGLDTHIQDIINVIEFEELDNIILVGHSFAGVTITGVADRLRDRIKHIVFFDAIAPSETRRGGVPLEPDGSLPDWFQKRAEKFIDGYKMDMWEEYKIEMLVPADSPHAARIKRLITTHPAKPILKMAAGRACRAVSYIALGKNIVKAVKKWSDRRANPAGTLSSLISRATV